MASTAAVANDALNGLEAVLRLGRLRFIRVDIEGGGGLGQDTGLQDGSTLITRAVVVEALADDLATLDDDATMSVVERRQGSLLQTEIHILVGLHCCLANRRCILWTVLVCLLWEMELLLYTEYACFQSRFGRRSYVGSMLSKEEEPEEEH